MIRRTLLGLFAAALLSPATLAANRIVSTDAAATELLVALGLQQQIVAVDVTSTPPRDGVAQVGYHRNLSAEGLLSLTPDLVVGSEHMGPPPVLSTLGQAGIALVQLEAARTPAQVAANIEALARAVSQPARGQQLLAQLKTALAPLQQQPLKTERIVFLLATDADKLRAAGSGSGGQAFIELLGSENAAQHQNYQTYSDESLLALAPTTLLVASSDPASVDQLLARHPLLAHTPAGQRGRILHVQASSLVAGLSLAAVSEAARIHVAITGNDLARAH